MVIILAQIIRNGSESEFECESGQWETAFANTVQWFNDRMLVLWLLCWFLWVKRFRVGNEAIRLDSTSIGTDLTLEPIR